MSSASHDDSSSTENATSETPTQSIGDLGTREQKLTMAAAAVKMGTGICARFLGEQWRARPEELEELAPCVVDVYEHECGEMPADPWARLYLALALFALPRVMPGLVRLSEPDAPQPPKPTEATTIASTPTPASAPTSSTFVEELDGERELAEIHA